ncbi:MAG: GLPGLI family protein [Chryseobacterium sp.]|uniref:GLPGLI family protein n=1 Tax=Chryseobacterium sp. TaxID=1871047 RepID=UPI0025C5F286|nr:GLPGLI family protein [Chryseobacterium sp.]MCJ7935264.1 GLPGLI family protein [Chryseobacterium sp.]
MMSKAGTGKLKVDDNNIEILGKINKQKAKYYKSSLTQTVVINEYIDDHSYWITDELPKIVWNTNYTDTKKIGAYICKKATAKFRGSKITAFYAPDLPFAVGPYKFYGLSGVILEIGEDNNHVNSWKAESIELNIPEDMVLAFPDKKTISYREFIRLQDEKDWEEVKRLTSNLNNGVVISIDSPKRNGIEKKYEWE